MFVLTKLAKSRWSDCKYWWRREETGIRKHGKYSHSREQPWYTMFFTEESMWCLTSSHPRGKCHRNAHISQRRVVCSSRELVMISGSISRGTDKWNDVDAYHGLLCNKQKPWTRTKTPTWIELSKMILNERKQNEISSTIAFIKKLKPQQKKNVYFTGIYSYSKIYTKHTR